MKPSDVLDAIAQNLLEEVSPPDPNIERPAVRVLVVDNLDEDVTDTVTVPAPAVVLSCTGFSDQSLSAGQMLVDADFIARCYARLPKGPTRADESRGDVAMNLAAAVAAAVEDTLWTGPGGEPVVVRRAERVRVQNRTGRASLAGGHALWTVRWQQRFELSASDLTEALKPFRLLHINYAMGDDETPDQSQLIEVNHG